MVRKTRHTSNSQRLSVGGISNASYLHDLKDQIYEDAKSLSRRMSAHSGFLSHWSLSSVEDEDMDEFIEAVRDIHGEKAGFENTDYNKRKRLTVMSM